MKVCPQVSSLGFPRGDHLDSVTLCKGRPAVVIVLKGRAPAKFSRGGGGGDTNVPSAPSAASLFVILHGAYPWKCHDLEMERRDEKRERRARIDCPFFTVTRPNQDTERAERGGETEKECVSVPQLLSKQKPPSLIID